MSTNKQYDGLEIAIVGISAQFPESDNYAQFWKNLREAKESLTFLTREELLSLGVTADLLENELFVPCNGGRVNNKELFDHAFFGYTPDEAALMDPQIRLLHQHCWNALEDAGYAAVIDKKKIGLFAGASANTNWKIYTYNKAKNSTVDPLYLTMISSPAFIASMVSYKLNLRGPAVYVDTACSTSLTAIHLACRSLLTRECTMALAGGVSIRTEIKRGYLYQEGKVSSVDGHCRAFDAAASGTAVGEGAGIVLLKRLNEAIKDNDHIYAVIRATAANNDGSQKAGYTTPSVKGQVDCITSAHKLANISAHSITYVEAHGTGTRLGDPVEVRALNEAFGTGGAEKFCALGTVKTNIGHLDTAAGVAGIIKTALSLKYRQLPASLHFRRPNPEIDFAAGPFYVNTSLQDWKRIANAPLRAGVSSFGIGGTNVHAVLEEAPDRESSDAERPYKLLCVSARTSRSIIDYAEKLKETIAGEEAINLSDVCYSLNTGRKTFDYRLSAVFHNREELFELLNAEHLQSRIVRITEKSPSVVFMFSGQGAQYQGMSKSLYESLPLFRSQMDEGFALLEALTGKSFKSILFNGEEDINNTRYTQPLLFLLEYSLAILLKQLGITPQYMIGHSIGEYTAACISGVFSFSDAMRLVVKRGELMSGLAHGSMLSIAITELAAGAYVNDKISLAAVNGPAQVVLSGDMVAVTALKARLEEDGISYITLHTSHAFHSSMLDPIAEAFGKELEKITFNKAEIPFLSNLSGTLITDAAAGSVSYWVKHMRETVRFSAGLEKILEQHPQSVFIELGAGHALVSLLKQHSSAAAGLNLLRGIKDPSDDTRYFTERLAMLWSHGIALNWEGYYKGEKRHKLSLPTYSFEPVSYPAEVEPLLGLLADVPQNNELKDWLYYPEWKRVRSGSPIPVPYTRVWLFFSFDGFFSGAVKGLLYDHDGSGTTIEVFQGDEYRPLSPNCYMINPSDPDHYDQLLEDIASAGQVVTDVIYGWGVGAGDVHLSLDADNHELHMVYFGLVYLVQSLRRQNWIKDRRLAVITDRLHEVAGKESGSYSQSLLLGLVNVLPQEYSLTCFNIDISLEENTGELSRQLSGELLGNTGLNDRIVALRHGYRWIKDYEKNSEALNINTLRNGGLYLITGGLGNVGYVLSRYLLETSDARVILTGRQAAGSLKPESQQRYRDLQNLSEKVTYLSLDVSDPLLLEQAVADIENRFGHIAGVIHAAGIIAEDHFELVEDMTEEKVIALMRPKVAGVMSLYKVFAKREPDFVWLTSSLSAVLGGLGFGAYAAANLYMDHFLQSKSSELPQWRSVCLGGMAFTAEERAHRLLLKPEDLCRLFKWSIGVQGSPIIIQSIEELSSRIHKVYEVKKALYLDEDDLVTEQQKTERPGLSSVYQSAETPTEMQMVNMFEGFFGISGIGITDNFFELGGDSLKAMMLVKRIKKEFEINITLTDFLMNTDIRSMSVKIDEQLWFHKDKKMDNEMVI